MTAYSLAVVLEILAREAGLLDGGRASNTMFTNLEMAQWRVEFAAHARLILQNLLDQNAVKLNLARTKIDGNLVALLPLVRAGLERVRTLHRARWEELRFL